MPCHQRLHADYSPGHAARRVRAHQCLFGLTPSTTVLITQTRPKFLARQRGEAQRGMLLLAPADVNSAPQLRSPAGLTLFL